MALTRIEAAELNGKGVIGMAAVPGLEALDMQKKFDELVTDVVVPKFNALSDELSADGGADKIGTAGGKSILEDLQELKNEKANTADILTKSNETPYTPTADYHPATKKYVDQIQLESGAGDMTKSVYDTDGDGVVDQAEDAQLLGGNAPEYFGRAPLRIEATLLADSWSGEQASFTQSVAIAQVVDADYPHVAPKYAQTLETALAQQDAWSCIQSAQAANGSVQFVCGERMPEVDIPIVVELLR